MGASATLPSHSVLSDRPTGFGVWFPPVGRQGTGFAPKEEATAEVRIPAYAPFITAPSAWLQAIEARILASVRLDESRGEPSTEWLNSSSAVAAIDFFRLGADLLPTEPHIYASRSGDLVAEFETPAGNLTCVVTEGETVLFAAPKAPSGEPFHGTIATGSKTLRDELRAFTQKMFSESHGFMETAG